MSNYLQKSKQYKGFHYSALPKELFDYLHNRTKAEFKKRIKLAQLYSRIFKAFFYSIFSQKDNTVYIILYVSKFILDKDLVLPLKKYTFEDEEVTSFNFAEKYLSAYYGKDFSKLSAEELRRIGINQVEILVGGEYMSTVKFTLSHLFIKLAGIVA